MIKEELGEDKFRFYCNDIDWDDDFDDLILILKSKRCHMRIKHYYCLKNKFGLLRFLNRYEIPY